jgi:hypothetical protein
MAHSWLRETRDVHLLGFGYNITNIQRLDLAARRLEAGDWPGFGGTALGLLDAEVTRAETALQLGYARLKTVDSLIYLRRFAPLK